MVDAERAARQLTNLAAHLNERLPDTVAFLARSVSGGAEVLSAELVADSSGELSALAQVAGEPTPSGCRCSLLRWTTIRERGSVSCSLRRGPLSATRSR